VNAALLVVAPDRHRHGVLHRPAETAAARESDPVAQASNPASTSRKRPTTPG
jgi:hypothetical protein